MCGSLAVPVTLWWLSCMHMMLCWAVRKGCDLQLVLCVQSALPSPAGAHATSGLSGARPADGGRAAAPVQSPTVSKRRSRRSTRTEPSTGGQGGPGHFQHDVSATKR